MRLPIGGWFKLPGQVVQCLRWNGGASGCILARKLIGSHFDLGDFDVSIVIAQKTQNLGP